MKAQLSPRLLSADIPIGRAPFPNQLSSPWGTLGQPDGGGGDARLLRVMRAGPVTLRHAFYDSGALVPSHRHEVPVFVYGLGGPCFERAEGETRSRRHVTLHPAGFEHSLHYRGPTHVVAIEFAPVGFSERLVASLPAHSLPLPATLYDVLWSIFVAFREEAPPQVVVAKMETLIEGAIRWSRDRRPGWLDDILYRIHDDWRRSPSVRALADQAEHSAPHVCRSFKEHVRVTLQQYGLLLRLDRARALLWSTRLPISAIAAETGFADQSHLTRAMAARSNLTPARLRQVTPCLRGAENPLSDIEALAAPNQPVCPRSGAISFAGPARRTSVTPANSPH